MWSSGTSTKALRFGAPSKVEIADSWWRRTTRLREADSTSGITLHVAVRKAACSGLLQLAYWPSAICHPH
jgi:hypothetical protein